MISFTASAAQFRRGQEAVTLFDLPPCPAGLVLAKADKLRPPGVGNGLGQVMVFEHAAHIQVLEGDIAI